MNDSIRSAAYSAPRHPQLPVDCNGALVRAQCRHLATVVTVSGTVDASNVDQVIEYAQRFNLPDKPFVLDLTGVDGFGVQAVRLLYAVDEACTAAGLEWAVIPSQAVSLTLLLTRGDIDFPTATTVHEALQFIADASTARRRVLLPLFTKTA
ncbi:STAS domain-containing protein [Mycobacterium sp.]|uniref:STAS domain-containing protein n=1 Tax=Mycobacterium sp. TaxID=1785 RepID=UPI0031D9134A